MQAPITHLQPAPNTHTHTKVVQKKPGRNNLGLITFSVVKITNN